MKIFKKKSSLSYDDALDCVKTALSVNAMEFAKATAFASEDKDRYIAIRDNLAKKILEMLGIKERT